MTDLVLAVLFVLAVLRARSKDAVPAPPALHRVLAVAWLAVVWLEVWGIGRGGDFKSSLWQLRPLFWAPVITYILAEDLRGPRDHEAIGKAVIAAASVKAALGAYYYFVVCRAWGYYPEYATTHSDSVLFVAAAVIAIAFALEKRTPRAAGVALAVLVPALIGIVVNGRRLAYIGPRGLRHDDVPDAAARPDPSHRQPPPRRGTPLTIAYLAAGWTSDAGVFAPARKVASLFSKTDRSSEMRDIENYNLVFTWKRHLVLGTGFGHEYSELTRPDGHRGHLLALPLHRAQQRPLARERRRRRRLHGVLGAARDARVLLRARVPLRARGGRPRGRAERARGRRDLRRAGVRRHGPQQLDGHVLPRDGPRGLVEARGRGGRLPAPGHRAGVAVIALDLALALLALPVLAASAYLAALAAAARAPAPEPRGGRPPRIRFDVIVPAHDEEAGVAATVASLLGVDYPEEPPARRRGRRQLRGRDRRARRARPARRCSCAGIRRAAARATRSRSPSSARSRTGARTPWS